MEIPSYVITWYAMDRLGRRWVLCLTMLLGGVACVSCMFVPEGTSFGRCGKRTIEDYSNCLKVSCAGIASALPILASTYI